MVKSVYNLIMKLLSSIHITSTQQLDQSEKQSGEVGLSISRKDFLKLTAPTVVSLIISPRLFKLDKYINIHEGYMNDLAESAKSFIARSPEDAFKVCNVLREKGGYPSNIDGPLSIAILLDWRLEPNGRISVGQKARLTGITPSDMFQANPDGSYENQKLFRLTFPPQDFDTFRVMESMEVLDFNDLPEIGELFPGDCLCLKGDTHNKLITISRMDEAGCLFSTTNIQLSKPDGYIIDEVMLWDPSIKSGYFRTWAAEGGNNEARLGNAGFYFWRRKSKKEILANDPISMKYRNIFVNKLREQEKGEWNILIKEIGKGELFEWRDGIAYHPASTIKVPIAVSVMQCIKELYVMDIKKTSLIALLEKKGVDNRTFKQLLFAMLVFSEEEATESCVNFINTVKPIDSSFKDLFMNETTYLPRRSSQRDLSNCWANLFLGKILDADSTSFLLNLLEQYTKNDDTLLGVIRNELPESRQWNKRGAVLTSDLFTLQDTGIIKIYNRYYYLGFSGGSVPTRLTTLEEMSLFIRELCNIFVLYVRESEQMVRHLVVQKQSLE